MTTDEKTPDFIPADQTPDLTTCDREPIHIPGAIQPVGFLVAVSHDWIVTHHSANLQEHLPELPGELLGDRLDLLMVPETFHAVQDHLQQLSGDNAVERLLALPVAEGGRRFDLTVQISGDQIILEGEPASSHAATDVSAQVRSMIGRVSRADTLEGLCDTAARQIRALIGFDRAMIYRFDREGAGEVIAEAREPHLESFLNLHYPATDIPKQARILYKRNLVRFICDVDMEVVPVQPVSDPEGRPLDMSLCALRAVSPIHLEYLRNMGVGASFSISIIVAGELWGLIACHHYSPRHLDAPMRSMAELFGQIFSLLVEQREREAEKLHELSARRVHDRLMAQLTGRKSMIEQFDDISGLLGEIIEHDGIAVCIEGDCHARGQTPSGEEISALRRFLNRTRHGQVYAVHDIGAVYEPGKDFSDRAAGLLAIPVSRTPRDYIILFRGEFARTVNWAGNPEKPVTAGPNGVRLTPRKSFEAWKETVTGQSKPWDAAELTAAEAIRITFLEVVLRMSESAEKEKTRANERQELLIAELNHRVRNILNLIKSLVNQSQAHARSADDFARTVSGRIQSLARAHDQITEQQWGPGSLHHLISTEAEAYALTKASRVAYTGPDVMLKPGAYTTLSLVIHELMTNSMKYGALSDSSGSIAVAVTETEHGAISLCWEEQGGPAVTPPKEKGFGSLIIERSVPFELDGEVDLDFRLSGLAAHFTIPSRHVAEFLPVPAASTAPEPAGKQKTGLRLDGAALVVEDNVIIALDAEEMLRQLGANPVSVKTNCADAIRSIRDSAPRFATLDINLGGETCLPIAKELARLDIPFVFTTGYGDSSELTSDFPDVPVVAKPYTMEALRESIGTLGLGDTQGGDA